MDVAGKRGSRPNKLPKDYDLAKEIESYDLRDDEGKKRSLTANTNHTIRDHVEKTFGDLKGRIDEWRSQDRKLAAQIRHARKFAPLARLFVEAEFEAQMEQINSKYRRASSFDNMEDANRFVAQTLRQNTDKLRDIVTYGKVGAKYELDGFFNTTTGTIVEAHGLREPTSSRVRNIRLVVYFDPGSPRRFRILTAFPKR